MPGRITHRGVHIEEMDNLGNPIEAVPTTTTAFVGALWEGPLNLPVEISSWENFRRRFGEPDETGSRVAHPLRLFFQNGGARALVVRVAAEDPEHLIGDPVAQTGIHALDTVDVLNLLVVPDTANLDDKGAAAVIAASQRYCERRRAFYLIDLPHRDADRDEVEEIRTWLEHHPQLRSPNAALYAPRLLLGDSRGACPPSGAVAGVYVRTDVRRGVWKAPAGTEARIRGIAGLFRTYSARDSEVLNPLAVNLIRSLPGQGPVVWGARTMQGVEGLASEWKYVPVRRLALFLEESVSRHTGWAVYEPNDETRCARLRSNVESFLHELFHRGAFAGERPEEGYFVRCERTTQPDNDQSVVRLVVGFAPLRPAEFVILRMRQYAGGAV